MTAAKIIYRPYYSPVSSSRPSAPADTKSIAVVLVPLYDISGDAAIPWETEAPIANEIVIVDQLVRKLMGGLSVGSSPVVGADAVARLTVTVYVLVVCPSSAVTSISDDVAAHAEGDYTVRIGDPAQLDHMACSGVLRS